MSQSDMQSNEQLVPINTKQFTFSNLGVWRKIYLVLNWIIGLGFASFLIMSIIISPAKSGPVASGSVLIGILCILILAYTYWLHSAVCKRNVSQLLIHVVLNIVPFLNPIGALIVFAARSTSKKEIEAGKNNDKP